MRDGLFNFGSGAVVGTLGGPIGLGGTERRLPVAVGVLDMPPCAAIPTNVVVSPITLTPSLIIRLTTHRDATPVMRRHKVVGPAGFEPTTRPL